MLSTGQQKNIKINHQHSPPPPPPRYPFSRTKVPMNVTSRTLKRRTTLRLYSISWIKYVQTYAKLKSFQVLSPNVSLIPWCDWWNIIRLGCDRNNCYVLTLCFLIVLPYLFSGQLQNNSLTRSPPREQLWTYWSPRTPVHPTSLWAYLMIPSWRGNWSYLFSTPEAYTMNMRRFMHCTEMVCLSNTKQIAAVRRLTSKHVQKWWKNWPAMNSWRKCALEGTQGVMLHYYSCTGHSTLTSLKIESGVNRCLPCAFLGVWQWCLSKTKRTWS